MSEAPDGDALEAQALAAMEPTDTGAATPPANADKPDTEAKGDPKSRLETTALTIGWSGKDAWKGDPADWLDAPEFILKAAGEVLPSMRKSLEKANDEIKGLKGAVKAAVTHMSKADERAYTRARADLEAELHAATDKADILAITKDIAELDKEIAERPKADDTPEEPAEMTAWREANPWYGVDEAHSAACDAIGKKTFEEGYTGKAQIAEVDKRMREKFPGLFAKAENPLRRAPGAVEGGTVNRGRGGKSFSDMPADAQAMCLDLMKLSKAITKENYAAQHFASAAQEQRR